MKWSKELSRYANRDKVGDRGRLSEDVDAIAGAESRGFLFGFALAERLGLPFIMIRKPGKLPAEKFKTSYSLEYGKNELEVHKGCIGKAVDLVDL